MSIGDNEPTPRNVRPRPRSYPHGVPVLDESPQDDEAIPLPARVASLERGRKWLTGIATAALLASGASFWSAAKELYEYGEREGAAAIRIEHLEKSIDLLREDLRDVREALGRRAQLTPRDRATAPVSPTFTASKGIDP